MTPEEKLRNGKAYLKPDPMSPYDGSETPIEELRAILDRAEKAEREARRAQGEAKHWRDCMEEIKKSKATLIEQRNALAGLKDAAIARAETTERQLAAEREERARLIDGIGQELTKARGDRDMAIAAQRAAEAGAAALRQALEVAWDSIMAVDSLATSQQSGNEVGGKDYMSLTRKVIPQVATTLSGTAGTALLAYVGRLEVALRDFRDHGIRCDLNPTSEFSDAGRVYDQLVGMLRFAHQYVTETARKALKEAT